MQADTLSNANLYAQFAHAFAPADPFIETVGDRPIRYADAVAHSAQAANALVACGLKPGDRLSVIADKSIELLWLYLGCLRAGVVYHPVNPAFTVEELRFLLADAEPGMVVCAPTLEADVHDIMGAGQVLTLDADGGAFGALRAAQAGDFETHLVQAADIAALLYSSGTTGRPKGIPLSHGNLSCNARALVQAWGFERDDCLLHVLPVYHVHGLFVALGCVMMSGARMRFMPRFSAADVLAELPGCSVMAGVPTHYTRLLGHAGLDAGCCAGMRVFICGSAPLLAATFTDFEARTGHRILERYGMTETGISTTNPLRGARKPGCVGRPLADVALRVVDLAGVTLPAHEIGNVEVRGPNVFAGYWRAPHKTAEDFCADGFFRTGDQAYLDDEGYVFLVGRSKDLIISGGENVYPKEVEAILDDFASVRESAVFGVPHADFGEAVVAAVVASGAGIDEQALRDALRARLAGFKVPKRIVSLDKLPRNTMGKVQKNKLRDTYTALFSSS